MSNSQRKYKLVFDLCTASDLLNSFNKSYIQLLANKSVDILDLKPDAFVETIRSTGELFSDSESEAKMDPTTWDDQDNDINELKKVYSLLQPTADIDNLEVGSHDYRFSKIEFLMFSGSHKNQLISKTLGFGVIRLFIKEDENYSEYDEGAKSDGTVLAILAVPSYFSIPDLFGFLGDDGREKVAHFRIFRSANPSRFMVLMKFRTKEDALEFQKNNNGREFSSLEPETCQVIEIEEIKFRPNRLTSSLGILSSNASSSSFALDYSSNSLNTADEKFVELPTCPICLERMDTSVTGLVTSSCLHTFHCMCLWKWKGGNCPVCRASSLEEKKRQLGRQRRCSICSTTNNLWLCLICGNIACGRYDSAHAVHHFKSTNHCYAIDLGSQSVWDYAEDRYVHRLIRNEADGKVVELPSREEKSKKLRSNSDVNNNNNVHDTESSGKGENDNELLITLLLNIIQNSNEEYSEVKDENILKQQELLEKIEELEKLNNQKVSAQVVEKIKVDAELEIQNLKISMMQMTESVKNDLSKRLNALESSSNGYKLENEKLQKKLLENQETIKQLQEKLKELESQTVPSLKESIKNYEGKIKQLKSKEVVLKKELDEEKEFSKAMRQKLEFMNTKTKQPQTPPVAVQAVIEENKKLKEAVKEKQDENQDLMFYIETLQKFQQDPELANADITGIQPHQ